MFKAIDLEKVTTKIETVFHDQNLNFNLDHRKLGNSTRDYLVYSFPDFSCFINNDGITPTLRIVNANDGSTAFRIMLGCIRWVCSNGLSAGDFLYSQRIVHVAGQTFDKKLSEIPKRVEDSIIYMLSDFIAELQEIVIKPVTESKSIEIIGNLNVPNKVKECSIYHLFNPRRQEDFNNNHTLWGLWNNVNESIRACCHGENAIRMNDKLIEDLQLLAA